MSPGPTVDWSNGRWEGSRRAQLRAALALSVRERLEALEQLAELSERLAAAGRVARGIDSDGAQPDTDRRPP